MNRYILALAVVFAIALALFTGVYVAYGNDYPEDVRSVNLTYPSQINATSSSSHIFVWGATIGVAGNQLGCGPVNAIVNGNAIGFFPMRYDCVGYSLKILGDASPIHVLYSTSTPAPAVGGDTLNASVSVDVSELTDATEVSAFAVSLIVLLISAIFGYTVFNNKRQ